MQSDILVEIRDLMAEMVNLLAEISGKPDNIDGICTLDEVANNVEAVARNLAEFRTEAVTELNSIESTLGWIQINTSE